MGAIILNLKSGASCSSGIARGEYVKGYYPSISIAMFGTRLFFKEGGWGTSILYLFLRYEQSIIKELVLPSPDMGNIEPIRGN